MSMIDSGIGSEKQEPKYVVLNKAINEISSLKDHACEIVAWIRGSELLPTEEIKKDPSPELQKLSLFSLLTNGPERIQVICKEVHEVLDEIKTILS